MTEAELIRCFKGDPERGHRELLKQFSGVILRMIRRLVHNPDDVMEVYTAIGERLQAHDFRVLRRFHSNSSLVPWLSVVVANACRDLFRKKRAVSMPQSVIDQLDEREQLVFRYYYQERYSHEEIAELVQVQHQLPCTTLDVVEAVARIDVLLSTKKRWHLLAALNSNAPPLSVEEMREFGQELFVGVEEGIKTELVGGDDRLRQVQRALESLDSEDRLLIQLRFEHGMTAQKIAQVLDFDNHKQVYTRLRTVLNRLRRHFDEDTR
jgi:DNA-directed RNA polymerase specialized sigma24 family protein